MVKKIMVSLAVIFVLLSQAIACKHLELDKERAEIEILGIEPRSSDGYLIPKELLKFWIKLKPLDVLPDTRYELVLSTHGGVIQATKMISWKAEELAGADPTERDVRKIREAENKAIRSVNLYADANDKEIEPLWREFNNFYRECRDKAAEHGELQFRVVDGWNAGSYEPDKHDFQRICNKYIEIRLLTDEEFDEIEWE